MTRLILLCWRLCCICPIIIKSSMYVFVPLQSNNPTNVTMYIYVVRKRDLILMSGQASLEFNCGSGSDHIRVSASGNLGSIGGSALSHKVCSWVLDCGFACSLLDCLECCMMRVVFIFIGLWSIRCNQLVLMNLEVRRSLILSCRKRMLFSTYLAVVCHHRSLLFPNSV